MNIWLLVDAKSVGTIPTAAIKAAAGRAKLYGLSLAMPWDALEDDFATAKAVAALARSLGLQFSLRIRGGQHTPPDLMGATWVPKGTTSYDIARGMTIPCPFNPDGSPNTTIVASIRQLATRVGAVAATEGWALVHGTWPGGPSAEPYVTPELTTLPGYSASVVETVHLWVLRAWQRKVPAATAIEMPIGGMGGTPFYNLQKVIYAAMHASTRAQFIQLNWWDDRDGTDTFTNFATRWPLPPRHGAQMIHPVSMDYHKAFDRLRASGAEYGEVFLKQFSLAGSDQLVKEINAG